MAFRKSLEDFTLNEFTAVYSEQYSFDIHVQDAQSTFICPSALHNPSVLFIIVNIFQKLFERYLASVVNVCLKRMKPYEAQPLWTYIAYWILLQNPCLIVVTDFVHLSNSSQTEPKHNFIVELVTDCSTRHSTGQGDHFLNFCP